MARKTREDYLKEKEAKARADLVRAARGGSDYIAYGRRRSFTEQALYDSETERLARKAAENEDHVAQQGPMRVPNLQHVLLVICLLVLAYLVLAELGLA